MDLPTSIFTYSVPQGQLLIFYPPAYKLGKTCGLINFLPGDGENNSLDIRQCYVNSLPRMIQAGMTPYSILPNKDTLWWIVACIHNNSGSAYRTQLKQILPWIFDKSGIRFDPAHVGVTGLSGGGSATWASVMIDTALSRRINWILPMANGGYDDQLSKLMANLVQACKNGVYFFPFIGTQDPGYNAVGFFAYDAVLKTYALKDHYHPHVVTGGKHDASTWDVPWTDRNIWDSLAVIGYTSIQPAPSRPVIAKLILDSTVIHYPNTSIYVYDSSYAVKGAALNNSYIMMDSVPSGSSAKGFTFPNSKGSWFFNLSPGGYRLRIYAIDSATNYVDTAYARFTVYGPAQRKVVSIQVPVFGVMINVPIDAAKIGYDDGNTN